MTDETRKLIEKFKELASKSKITVWWAKAPKAVSPTKKVSKEVQNERK